MKKTLFSLFVSILLIVNICIGQIKIIIDWGQSNTDCRVTLASSTPAFLVGGIAENVKVWNGTSIVDYDCSNFGPTGNGSCFAEGNNSQNKWGFDLCVANNISQYYPGYDIVLCKVTNGSSPIMPFNTISGNWSSNYGAIPGTTPKLLQLLNNHYDALITYCTTNTISYEVLFIMGKQGEADDNVTAGDVNYETNYQGVIDEIRDFTGIADLPFFVSTIGTGSLSFNSTIDNAMRDIAAADPDAYLIDLSDATFIGDNLHDDATTSTRHANMIVNTWIDREGLLPAEPTGLVTRLSVNNFFTTAGKSIITNKLSRDFINFGDYTIQAEVQYIEACTRALIDNGLDDNCVAFYPFVGGTADKHKINLMDPQDTDGAHRITWGGTVTHSSNGVQGNGTTGYGDTHLTGTPLGTNAAFYYYSRTDLNNTSMDFGVQRASSPNSRFWSRCRNSGNYEGRIWQASTTITYANGSSNAAFWGGRRTTGTAVEYAGKNNGSETTVAAGSSGVIGNNINLLCLYDGITAVRSNFSSRQYCCFVFFSGEISQAEFQAFHDDMQAAQTILGRQN